MRPTGSLHLGHYHGALKNWVRLQSEYPCLFFVADWHALTTHYDTPAVIEENVWDMVIDWLAAGVDPAQATLFIQSRVPEHAELHTLLSMITPLGWLERVPTYKDQQEKLADRDLSTYGFLGYPLLQSGRHPDVPRQVGAGGRGPGPARRTDARSRAPLQPPLRPRAGLRGQGAGRGEEARQQERRSSIDELRTRYQEQGDDEALAAGAGAARRAAESRAWAIASACSAIWRAAGA